MDYEAYLLISIIHWQIRKRGLSCVLNMFLSAMVLKG